METIMKTKCGHTKINLHNTTNDGDGIKRHMTKGLQNGDKKTKEKPLFQQQFSLHFDFFPLSQINGKQLIYIP